MNFPPGMSLSLATQEYPLTDGPVMSQPAPFSGGLVPTLPRPPRRHFSALTIVTMVVLGLGTLVIAFLLLLSGGPADAVITIFLAAISFPLLILLCFWLDRYEPEPTRYRIAALGWGGVIAVGIGLGLEFLFMRAGASTEATTVVWAPISEELGKGLFPLMVLLLRRQQLHGILDGIVYAVLTGIGFAFTEDVLYYLQSLVQGGAGGLASTFVLRGVLSPFAHPLFTSATGVGIGIAVMSRSRAVQVGAPILGYVVAVLLHATWNGSATFGGTRGFFLTYLVAFLPLLIVLIVIAVWARRQEGRMLTRALQDCARMGWVSPGEIRWVATLSDRVSARKYAKSVGGRQAREVLSHYQQALTEMAFLHNRVVSGTAPADFNQRMYEIQQRAALLRPGVILPPAAIAPPYPASGYGPGPGYVGPGYVGPGYGPGPGLGPDAGGTGIVPQEYVAGSQWSPIPGQTLQPPGEDPSAR
jgi:RsiW-degrading membrane proteinase PrsW (M82 family)